MKKLIFTTVLILFGFFGFSQVDCEGQRTPIHELTQNQRDVLNDLILQYVQSQINPDYDPDGEFPDKLLEHKYTIVAQHTDFGSNHTPWHDPIELFFSWHRDYIAGLEQFFWIKVVLYVQI